MDMESVFGAVVMVLCSWGCAGVFTGIALHGRKKNTPMGFWSGTTVDPRSVVDIPAYNRENSNMWLVYSIPYWVSGVVSFFFGAGDFVAMIAVAILMIACVPGIGILIWWYRKICNRYVIPHP